MLLELNGGRCEVVTGVSIVYPILTAPGYAIKYALIYTYVLRLTTSSFPVRSMDDRTIVYFYNSSIPVLEAYVDSGEGLDRAGGFALQQRGAHLVYKIEGDFYNAVGFPGASFFRWLGILVEEEDDFLEDGL